jgi:FKBP-type peptidyl-prolyl cis-trans isomerase
MKRLAIIAICLAFALPISAEGPESAAPADVSYALGMILGSNLKSSGLEIVPSAFTAGLKDVLDGAATKYDPAQAQAVVQAAFQAVASKKSAENLAAGRAFLASNLKKAGITATASGLQYEVLSPGSGPKPLASDMVKVNYEGKLLDGTVFDSSIARNEPATFPLDGVIPGWTEGVQLMPVGSKYRFFVPSELAYGEQGAGDVIEPNSVLIFEVELLSIETEKN